MNNQSNVSMLNLLFEAFINISRMDSTAIAEDFKELRQGLSGLSFQEADRVVDSACKLCFDHERVAFIEGIKAGVQLKTELEEWL